MPHDRRPLLALAFLACLALTRLPSAAPHADEPKREDQRFFKGNTHTHTLWSDGDASPQQVVLWYRERGYDFLSLTDHNVLLRGERWFTVADEGARDQRLTPERLRALRAREDLHPIETRERDGREEMRLWTLDELRERFEAPNEFLLVEGEEVTGGFDGKPVHINALGLRELLIPGDGETLPAMMDDTVADIRAHGRAIDVPVVAHVNHPNFQWGIRWDELAALTADRFFEVYNGHPSVRNAGDATHPGTDEMWDRALAHRMRELGMEGEAGLLYGLATDDSHHYHEWSPARVNPGRGWVRVRAERLDERALLEALRRGDFYSSSGVELRWFEADARGLRFAIDAQPGWTYVTRFVGTRRANDAPVGEVFAESEGLEPRYDFRGDELYVRAVVAGERPKPESAALERRDPGLDAAWLQPIVPR